MHKNPTIHLHVRTKTWIENDQQDLLFGKEKTEILELIEQEGSIAKAAERMGMNYKKPGPMSKSCEKISTMNWLWRKKEVVAAAARYLCQRRMS